MALIGSKNDVPLISTLANTLVGTAAVALAGMVDVAFVGIIEVTLAGSAVVFACIIIVALVGIVT